MLADRLCRCAVPKRALLTRRRSALIDCYCVAARAVADTTLCALPLVHAEQRVQSADGKVVIVV
jgi:hypothetical protein